MQDRFGRLVIGFGAATLFALAVALPAASIGVQDPHETVEATHSWVANAFPTGQASFAHGDERKS